MRRILISAPDSIKVSHEGKILIVAFGFKSEQTRAVVLTSKCMGTD